MHPLAGQPQLGRRHADGTPSWWWQELRTARVHRLSLLLQLLLQSRTVRTVPSRVTDCGAILLDVRVLFAIGATLLIATVEDLEVRIQAFDDERTNPALRVSSLLQRDTDVGVQSLQRMRGHADIPDDIITRITERVDVITLSGQRAEAGIELEAIADGDHHGDHRLSLDSMSTRPDLRRWHGKISYLSARSRKNDRSSVCEGVPLVVTRFVTV